MLKNILLTLLSIFVFVSCQTKTNQYIKISDKIQKRHGKWIEKYPTEEGTLHTREHLDKAIAAFEKVGKELGVIS